MAAIHDVLFRLLGDDEDARESLEEITSELVAFSKIHAEAEATLDIGDAQSRLEELRVSLDRLDATTSEPKISTDIAGVMAQIVALERALEALDGKDVDIDIDVQRGIAERLGSIGSQVVRLGKASEAAEGQAQGFFSRIANSAVHMGPFTTQLKTAIPLVGVLAAAIVSLGGALAAMVASFGAAVLGAGALATAFVGVLIPGIGLGIAAIQRFQQQSGKPGTAAHALATAFEDVKSAAKGLLPAVDPVLRGLASLLRELPGLVRAVGPAFALFAKAAADALGPIVRMMRSDEFRGALMEMIAGASAALKPLVRIGTELFRIFINIANAAMPFLVAALQDVVKWLRGLRAGTDNVLAMRIGIGVLVDHLKLWLDLIGQISRVFINFAEAALPAGKEFVGWLRDGAEAIADWLSSKEGVEHVQRFFEDTLPLAKSLVTFVAKLALAFVQLGEFVAPMFKPIVDGFNAALDVINFVLDKLNSLPGPIRQIIGFVGTLLLPFGKLKLILAAIEVVFSGLFDGAGAALKGIKGIAEDVFGWLKGAANDVADAVSDAWVVIKVITTEVFGKLKDIIVGIFDRVKGVVTGAVDRIKSVVSGAWHAIRSVTETVWDAIKSVIDGVWERIKSIVTGAVDRVKSILSGAWDIVKSVADAAWQRIKDFIVNPILDVVSRLRDLVDLIKGVLDAAWERVKSVVADAWGFVKDKIVGAIQAALDWLGDVPGKIFDLGKKIMEGLLHGLESLVSDVKNVVTGVVDWVTGKVNLLNNKVDEAFDAVADLNSAVEQGNKAEANMPHGGGGGGKGKVASDLSGVADAIRKLVTVAAPSPFTTPALAGATATAPAAAKAAKIEQHFHVPPAPAGKQPDPRHTAAQLAEIMRSRGGA